MLKGMVQKMNVIRNQGLRHDTPITDPIPDCATNTLKLSCCSVSN